MPKTVAKRTARKKKSVRYATPTDPFDAAYKLTLMEAAAAVESGQSDDDVRDLLAGIDHAEIRVEKFASEG
jgi:hypothetical protein